MAYFSTESAESAINELTNYMSRALEYCDVMNMAGKNCEDNMANDEIAAKANKLLQSHLNAIQMNINMMNNVIKGIQREMEHYNDIKNAGNSL